MKKLDSAACIAEPANGQARTIKKLEVSIVRMSDLGWATIPLSLHHGVPYISNLVSNCNAHIHILRDCSERKNSFSAKAFFLLPVGTFAQLT